MTVRTPEFPPMIYIAGPLSAETPYERRRNIEAARDLAYKVAGLGAYPVTPHLNTGQEFFGTLDEKTLWLPGTMELLRRCDAMVLHEDWRFSSGSKAEKAWADVVGMPSHVYDEGEARGEDPAMRDLSIFIHRVMARQYDGYDYLHWGSRGVRSV